MKKLFLRSISALAAVLLCLALAACGGKDEGSKSDTPSGGGQTTSAAGTAKTYTVKYVGGEGATGTAPADITAEEGDRLGTMKNPFTKDGYQFIGWSDGETTYPEMEFFTVTKNITFTALWEEVGTGFYLLNTAQNDERWQGFPATALKTGDDDRKYYETAYSGDIVWVQYGAGVNVKEYADGGGNMHLSMYVDNPDIITGGQIELTTSGAPDADEYSFGELGKDIKLTAGWNDLVLPMASAHKIGNPDWANIQFIRIYINVEGGTLTAGITDFFVDFPAE